MASGILRVEPHVLGRHSTRDWRGRESGDGVDGDQRAPALRRPSPRCGQELDVQARHEEWRDGQVSLRDDRPGVEVGLTASITARTSPRSVRPVTAPTLLTALAPIMWPASSARLQRCASFQPACPGRAPALTRTPSTPATNASPAPVASTTVTPAAGATTWPCTPIAAAPFAPRVRIQ